MSDDHAGPWLLALGALTVGVAAFVAELRRQRRDDGAVPTSSDDAT